MTTPLFYLTLVLVVIILIVPVIMWRFYFVDVRPTLSDRVRKKQRLEGLRYRLILYLFFHAIFVTLRNKFYCRNRESQDVMRTPSARHKRRSIRSGYAFAHQEGFGRLITSGKMSVYRHNNHERSANDANHVKLMKNNDDNVTDAPTNDGI